MEAASAARRRSRWQFAVGSVSGPPHPGVPHYRNGCGRRRHPARAERCRRAERCGPSAGRHCEAAARRCVRAFDRRKVLSSPSSRDGRRGARAGADVGPVQSHLTAAGMRGAGACRRHHVLRRATATRTTRQVSSRAALDGTCARRGAHFPHEGGRRGRAGVPPVASPGDIDPGRRFLLLLLARCAPCGVATGGYCGLRTPDRVELHCRKAPLGAPQREVRLCPLFRLDVRLLRHVDANAGARRAARGR